MTRIPIFDARTDLYDSIQCLEGTLRCTNETDNSLGHLTRNRVVVLELSSLIRCATRLQRHACNIRTRSHETRSRRVREVEGSREIDVATDTRIDGSNITPSCRTGSILARHQSSRWRLSARKGVRMGGRERLSMIRMTEQTVLCNCFF